MRTRERITLTARLVSHELGEPMTITRFAPGDGWARYSAHVRTRELTNSRTAKEMEIFLEGMYQTILAQKDIAYEKRHTPTPRKKISAKNCDCCNGTFCDGQLVHKEGCPNE